MSTAYGTPVVYAGKPATFIGYRHTPRSHVVTEEARLAVLLQDSRFITVPTADVADTIDSPHP